MKQNSMTKFLRKILILSLLSSGLMIIAFDNQFKQTAHANALYCDFQAQMSSFVQCDNDFLNTNAAFENRNDFCNLPVAERCNPADPNYSWCVNETTTQCINNRTTAFNNNYNTFGDCVNGLDGIMYNPNYCTQDPDPCPDVLNRVAECRAILPADDPLNHPGEMAAQRACIESIPHVVASKGGYTCPGTNYFPE